MRVHKSDRIKYEELYVGEEIDNLQVEDLDDTTEGWRSVGLPPRSYAA